MVLLVVCKDIFGHDYFNGCRHIVLQFGMIFLFVLFNQRFALNFSIFVVAKNLGYFLKTLSLLHSRSHHTRAHIISLCLESSTLRANSNIIEDNCSLDSRWKIPLFYHCLLGFYCLFIIDLNCLSCGHIIVYPRKK